MAYQSTFGYDNAGQDCTAACRMFVDKKIYDKYGYYDDSFMIAGDFELMLRFIECT